MPPPPAGFRAARVEVRLLGPFHVHAPGAPAADQQPALAVLVAMAAGRPAGVPTAVVEQLFPQPGGLLAASQHIKDWLGADATGQPRLTERAGAWRLSPEVWVDWVEFQRLVTSPGADGDPHRFAQALAMIRGELLAGLSFPPALQPFVPPLVADVRLTTLEAVRREVELARNVGDPHRAERALRQGLSLLPREEALWRLRLEL